MQLSTQGLDFGVQNNGHESYAFVVCKLAGLQRTVCLRSTSAMSTTSSTAQHALLNLQFRSSAIRAGTQHCRSLSSLIRLLRKIEHHLTAKKPPSRQYGKRKL